MDKITPERRSLNMSRIRGKNTKPELTVRKILRELGVGYRLHSEGLPGRPDIVMKGRKQVILVHGCFWHRHEGCKDATIPKSRIEFWQAKFEKNLRRDQDVRRQLEELEWSVILVWECQTAKPESLKARLALELKPLAKS